MDYYAKSNPVETLDEHIEYCLRAFNNIMSQYGMCFSDKEKVLIENAIRYHDEGKKNPDFQVKIKKAAGITATEKEIGINIPHGYLSPAFIPSDYISTFIGKEEIEEKKAFYQSILYHHLRKEPINEEEIRKYIKMLEKLFDKKLNAKYLKYRNLKTQKIEEWIKFAIIKGMLNKCDYYASAHPSFPIEIVPKRSISSTVETFMNKNKMTPNEMQTFLRDHHNENCIVIASTGSGKTEGSLLWAGKGKTFYTLPLRVSINTMYDRIKNKYNYEDVLPLHSDALGFMNIIEGKKFDDAYLNYKAAKSFSSPLTISTIDQLLTFCYKYMGCEILLASLKYSNLIIDEIQAYSPELIAKIIYALKLIKMAGGNFLIMTATLPPVLTYFLDKEGVFSKEDKEHFKIVPSDKKRHKISLCDGEFDYEKIKEAGKTKKVLVICNTVKKAQQVYTELKSENTWLLHSRFIGKDKRKQEKDIIRFAEGDKPGIWITTQIVEASVDVDFDLLFTEMCTIDSLLQRLGRCYRKREYSGNEPNCYIYDTGNGVGSVYDEVIYNRSIKYLLPYNNVMFTEEDKLRVMDAVYDEKDEEVIKSNYYKGIKNQLNQLESYTPGYWEKAEAMKTFRNICTISVMPKRIFDELNKRGDYDNLLKRLDSKDKSERLKAEDELKNFLVNVRHNSTIKKNTYLEVLDHGFIIVQQKYEYDETTGHGPGFEYERDEDPEEAYL